MNETTPWNVNATNLFKSGQKVTACLFCENLKAGLGHEVKFIALDDLYKIKPLLNGTLKEVYNVEIEKNQTLSLPGVFKYKNLDGEYD